MATSRVTERFGFVIVMIAVAEPSKVFVMDMSRPSTVERTSPVGQPCAPSGRTQLVMASSVERTKWPGRVTVDVPLRTLQPVALITSIV